MAEIPSLIQAWADGSYTDVAVGLKAESETDTKGWKRFNSANSGVNIPTLWVNYNSYPGPATNLTITPSSPADGIVYSPTTTPTLTAVGHDADGGGVNMLFRLHPSGNATPVWEKTETGVPVETPIPVAVPAGKLVDGSRYSYIVHTYNDLSSTWDWNTANSGWHDVIIDTSKPPAPASIASSDYPNDGTWHGVAGQAGTFTVTPTPGEVNPAGYLWGLDTTSPTSRTMATGTIPLSVTPPTNGPHFLSVRAIDKAGNVSEVVRYAFNVGRGGLTSPSAGERVMRRARLVVTADPALPYAQFQWRRGQDAATSAALPLPVLTRADGSPLTAAWTALSSLGDYTTWDAGTTLGAAGGPAQVRVVLATDASGTNAYESPWVDIVVDPNADGAASTGIGPGSVNLLTGDYSLSVTDADEFGLAVGRSASSRDPKSGYQEQAQLLTPAQMGVTGDMSGFVAVTASAARVTNRGHTGMDALQVLPTSGGADTTVALGGDSGAMRLGMRAGHTYRVTGWIYVPAATGLAPPYARGLRLTGFVHTPAGYNEPTSDGNSSARPTVTDAWQQLSFDFAVPSNATEAFIRLYNGFDQGSGKEVFFDDLSVREIWAPLGPQWSLGTADAAAETGYTYIDQPSADAARLNFSGGGEVWFTASGDGRWFPELGAEDYKLAAGSTAGSFILAEVDGTVSTFVRGANGLSMLETTKPPAAPGATRMVYEVVDQLTRLKRIIGPAEPGVDPTPGVEGTCGAATPARGCEVTELVYATATTAGANSLGDFATRLQRVEVWSTDSATGTVSKSPVAQYAYDAAGRLREVWDPRVSPALKTAYDYDAAGHVISLTPAGEPAWRFGFAATPSDDNPGRLTTVTRASLVAGTTSTLGPDNTTTLRYAVPLTRATGGPYDLGPADLATWGQKGAPTDATAVFGPADVPGATLGAEDYKAATVHYLDSSGREVDTATPAGAGAPVAGYIDSADFDKFGNTVRTLDATNRLLALGLTPSSTNDLATLGLTGFDSATRAAYLSSVSTYAGNGIDLLATRGPVRPLWSGPNQVVARLLTTNTYDQGKPDGQEYHLVTTSVTGAETTATPPVVLDPVTTTTSYAPAAAGDTSGWVVRKPTSVTLTAAGTSVTSTVKYDSAGRAIEARKPGSTGADALTTKAVYWTAGANTADAGCGDRPEWAGQACVPLAVGAITGVDATRMGTALPVKRVNGYSRYGTPTVVTESGTGPVSGISQTWTRTTTTTVDLAERVTSVAITGTNLPTGGSVDKVVTDYDPATGQAVANRSVNGSGTTTGTISRQLDVLGRTVKYTDATGAYAASSYDQYGQPKTYAEFTASGVSIGSRDFTYDRAIEPRGLLTKVHDSVAGDITATYGPDGQILTQDLPGGIRVTTTYDPSVSPLSRIYTRISDGQPLGSSVITENTKGKWATHATTAASSSYTYDAFGRLTDVQQTTAVTNICTWRHYGFTDRAARTSKATKTSNAGCAPVSGGIGTPDSTIGYTYDSADRLVSDTSTATSPWTYDPLGRITSARSSLNPALTLASTYWDNDKIHTQTIAGVGTQSWTLDPLGRFNTSTSSPAVGPGVTTVKTNHYTGDGDNPAWIGESATDPNVVTRYVTGIDGRLALSTSKTGDPVLQMVDLHGDVMGTLTLDTAGSISTISYTATDEYGTPLDLNTGGVSANAPPRYGWLGGAQRSGETLGGTILMGSRIYAPGVGRFLSIDPTPGGNANIYDYCTADPVNCTDLTGNWPDWGAVLNVVAIVAEVVATVVPGPIGTAAGFISAGAYLATGNTSKATEMAITAGAALLGCGACGKALAKVAGAASKIGRMAQGAMSKVVRAAGASQCFVAGTQILMADGTNKNIEDIRVGDQVTSTDPDTGVTSSQTVAQLFQHEATDLLTITIGQHSLTVTTEHPFYVPGKGWIPAHSLRAGDPLRTPSGATITVSSVVPGPAAATVYNFEVTNTHTYYVHTGNTTWALVHNTCALVQRAEELAARAGRNRVSAETPTGRLSIDLRGRAHYEKSTSSWVRTPHVKFETRHVGRNGRVSYKSGPVSPATHAHLRIFDRLLSRRGL